MLFDLIPPEPILESVGTSRFGIAIGVGIVCLLVIAVATGIVIAVLLKHRK